MKKLPVYLLSIDGDELGVSEIAVLNDPAIEKVGIAFNNQLEFRSLNIHPNCQCQIVDNVWKFGEDPCEICLESEKKWKEGKETFETHKQKHNKPLRFADELKYRVAAPILRPMDIYRFSNDIGEYEVRFTKDLIEQIVGKLMKNGITNKFNLDHTDKKVDAYLLEHWFITDPKTDRSYTEFGIEGLEEGCWFGVVQYNDKEFFNTEVIGKGKTGFSVEGLFDLVLDLKNKFKKMELEKLMEENALLKEQLEAFTKQIEELKLAVDKEKVNCAPQMPGDEETPAEQMDPNEEDDSYLEPVDEPKIDEEAVKSIVQPMLDEVYKVISEIKTLVDGMVNKNDSNTESVKMAVEKTKIDMATINRLFK